MALIYLAVKKSYALQHITPAHISRNPKNRQYTKTTLPPETPGKSVSRPKEKLPRTFVTAKRIDMQIIRIYKYHPCKLPIRNPAIIMQNHSKDIIIHEKMPI